MRKPKPIGNEGPQFGYVYLETAPDVFLAALCLG